MSTDDTHEVNEAFKIIAPTASNCSITTDELTALLRQLSNTDSIKSSDCFRRPFMNFNLTKAEILWTRVCPLNCSYCAMASGERNSRSLDDWKIGFENLKALGCKFVAIYGAEPLADFSKLPQAVGFAEHIGLNTTVITSGVVKSLKEKLNLLYAHGATSLSMSYDIEPLDHASELKSALAIKYLRYFQSLGSNIRDVAAIITLTKTNFRALPETIKLFSEYGIWIFFDFIHPFRQQPGSKCRGAGTGLTFDDSDLQDLDYILKDVLRLKENKYLVHTSKEFIDIISAENYRVLREYSWNCGKADCFPSWVTIDCDGSVHICDDYQIRDGRQFDMTTLAGEWEAFKSNAKEIVKGCPGCAWNTHIDSHLVKEGKLDISNYIHGELRKP